jgi:multidrug resistance efflux pump
LSECVIRQYIDTGLEKSEGSDTDSPVFREVLQAVSQKHGVGLALNDSAGVPRGAVIFFWEGKEKDTRFTATFRAASPLLASSFELIQRKKGGSGGKTVRKYFKSGRSGSGLLFLVIAVIIGFLSALPVPFQVHTKCSVLPVYKRFVVAGFDGILQEALVQPGDRVHRGQVLARLDGRETALLKSSLEAERKKALKTRDHHLAMGNTAGTQVAGLEVRRLEKQIELLAEREQHLVLTSPIEGIVLAGDMMRIEGSPVSKGQVLFEVSPLNKVIVELGVEEKNIGYVSGGMPVKIRFEAFRNRSWRGEVQRIKPEAEIRNNQNVFLAELEFENSENMLRPGMKGRGNINTGRKALGWILFRKPWYTILRLKDAFW